MKKPKNQEQDAFIDSAINQIKAEMRTVPDAELWNRVVGRITDEVTGTGKITYSTRPILKLAGSISAAAAAIAAGILFANLYYKDSPVNEKDTYKQEIYAEASDFTGWNDKASEYYNAE